MKKIILITIAFLLTGYSSIPAVAAGELTQIESTLTVASNTKLNDAITYSIDGRSVDLNLTRPNNLESDLSIATSEGGSGLLASNASVNASNVAAVLATEDTVSLAWDFRNSDAPVNIYLDGQKIAEETSSGSLSANSRILDSSSSLIFEQVQVPDASGLVGYTQVSLSATQPNGATYASALVSVSALVSNPPASTVLRYQTFIPYEYAPVPPAGCNASLLLPAPLGYEFHYLGNNRTYGAGSTNNKTALQVNIDWVNSNVTSTSTVGETYIYLVRLSDNSRTLYGHANAGTSGITVTRGTFATNSLYVHLHHDVANPDCPFVQGIYYDVSGTIYRSGGYSLSGKFIQVPNHEFYLRDSNTQIWSYIYRSDINGALNFYCFTLGETCMTTSSWNTPNTVWYHP